jgi:hypothetical protein
VSSPQTAPESPSVRSHHSPACIPARYRRREGSTGLSRDVAATRRRATEASPRGRMACRTSASERTYRAGSSGVGDCLRTDAQWLFSVKRHPFRGQQHSRCARELAEFTRIAVFAANRNWRGAASCRVRRRLRRHDLRGVLHRSTTKTTSMAIERGPSGAVLRCAAARALPTGRRSGYFRIRAA